MTSPIELTIIPPTYNESENVEILFKEILQAMKYTKRKYEVLFVDDSNDETPHIIYKMMEKNENIRLIHREKKKEQDLQLLLPLDSKKHEENIFVVWMLICNILP